MITIRIILSLFLCVLITNVKAQQNDSLQSCDLIFVTAPQRNAITDVTEGFQQMPIDHVAIFYRVGNRQRIIEAVPDGGVLIDDLQHFIAKNEGAQAYVGRVQADIDLSATLKKAFSFVGRPYDYLFLADNDAIYCSELVQFSFVDKQGRLLFSPIPMSFHDNSGHITTFWKTFYSKYDMAVPEGQPGSNPGELSRRRNIAILFRLF